MNVVIFAGTTEGRRLSDMLRRDHIRHHVCVATGYGADMMQKDDPYIILHEGRMDKARMRSFFEENGFTDPEIIPISALSALVFKKVLNQDELTRLEKRFFKKEPLC